MAYEANETIPYSAYFAGALFGLKADPNSFVIQIHKQFTWPVSCVVEDGRNL